MTKTKAERDQSRRFIDAAHQAGCDDDPKAFERVFAKIAPPKKAGDTASKPRAESKG